MMSFLENFHFIRPIWLISLIFPIIFYLRYFKGIKNKSSWENICDKNLLNFLLIKGSSQNRKVLGYIALATFIITILSISGPTWSKKQAPNLQPENPVLIALNLSSDMNQKDIKPDRLTRAKHKISDLLLNLKSIQVGMIVYSDEPFLITPITDDKNIIINLLANIDINIMPSNGDRLDRAIEMSLEKLKNAGYKTANIVLLASDVGQKFDLAIKNAQDAHSQGYGINIINISSQNNEKLEMIARNGGGKYVLISPDDKDIKTIVEKINEDFNSTLKKSENISMVWEEYGYWLSIITLVLSLYFFRRGILVIAFIILASNSAQASFFLNNNEEGLKYFEENSFEMAKDKFEDTKWLASSYYRLGDYEKAYEEFAKSDDETAIYNQGNALAKAGKTEDAIKKYEAVLEKNPNHEDAKFNLEYLKQKQDQQQNSSSNSQDKDDKKNQDEQNNSSDKSQEQDQNSEENDNKDQNNQENGDDKDEQKQNTAQEKDEKNQKQQKQNNPSKTDDKSNNNEGDEEQQTAAKNAKQGDEDWDEELQALEQQYREIPENSGGLLNAFIKKEYNKNRYKN